jgi:hypothetical protein
LCFSKEGERGASLKINIGELLSVVAVHDEAGVVEFFNRPRGREATRGGGHGLKKRPVKTGPAGLLLSERSPLSLRLSLEGKESFLLLQTGACRPVTSPLPLRRWRLQACDAHSPARYLIFAGHCLIVCGVLCEPVRVSTTTKNPITTADNACANECPEPSAFGRNDAEHSTN